MMKDLSKEDRITFCGTINSKHAALNLNSMTFQMLDRMHILFELV